MTESNKTIKKTDKQSKKPSQLGKSTINKHKRHTNKKPSKEIAQKQKPSHNSNNHEPITTFARKVISISITPYLLTLITFSFATIFLSRYLFIFDLFSHFQLQITVGITLLSITALILKHYKSALIGFSYTATIIATLIYPAQFIDGSLKDPDIVFLNSQYTNTDADEAALAIKSYEPRFVATVETNPQMDRELRERYGSPVIYHIDNFKSCAIYALDKSQVTEAYVTEDEHYPICIAQTEEYTIIAVHPFPPLTPDRFSKQRAHFSYIREVIDDEIRSGRDFVLVGDFNSTYYSGNFREYFGTYFEMHKYTWGSNTPLAIPIDHAMSNLDLRVSNTSSRTSDHDMLLIQIQ